MSRRPTGLFNLHSISSLFIGLIDSIKASSLDGALHICQKIYCSWAEYPVDEQQQKGIQTVISHGASFRSLHMF